MVPGEGRKRGASVRILPNGERVVKKGCGGKRERKTERERERTDR